MAITWTSTPFRAKYFGRIFSRYPMFTANTSDSSATLKQLPPFGAIFQPHGLRVKSENVLGNTSCTLGCDLRQLPLSQSLLPRDYSKYFGKASDCTQPRPRFGSPTFAPRSASIHEFPWHA